MGSPRVPTLKKLFALSGNRCAFPKCPVRLVREESVVGEVCHIRGQKPDAPRYDSSQTEEQRHSFENLILLCPTHHTVIDADEEAYTVNRLAAMKANHEHQSTPTAEPAESVLNQLVFNVTSHNQTGGVTAGLYVNQAPKPTWHTRELFANVLEKSGEYHTRIEVTVDSPYPAHGLRVEVRAPSLIRMDLKPDRAEISHSLYMPLPEGDGHYRVLQSPFGRNHLDIFTARPEACRVTYAIE